MKGHPNPVKFVSYIWKRIDGFTIDYLKKDKVVGFVKTRERRLKISVDTSKNICKMELCIPD